MIIGAAVPVEDVEKIDMIAEKDGFFNRSFVVRQALTEYIKKWEATV